MNHYEVLGVDAGADQASLRRAYLAAARQHHPDFHEGDSSDSRSAHAVTMQAINQAWAVLGDSASRSRYDLTLASESAASARTEVGRPDDGPQMPPGKGWTPRFGDDAWQRDFVTWAEEDDIPPPDEAGERRRRGPLVVLPVALFAAAVIGGFVAVVLTSRALVAFSIVALFASVALFLMLPLVEMRRSNRSI